MLIVNGAARPCTYSVSDAEGSFVLVLAQRSLCVRAPRLSSRCHRSELICPRYARYADQPDCQSQHVLQVGGRLVCNGDIPARHEHGSDRADRRVQPLFDAALDAPEVGTCGRLVLVGREEQCHVYRNA